ncbi:uncharacterized protein LOC124955340 [Vespa velutina]|uniref:uncharacterized protein LOC124955340 n=1 Tax=Vespa velutina TaxID=202808 RepID=UPI001FB40688|nr:uncharacterized protein LOC124955340 [Vespa velutina]
MATLHKIGTKSETRMNGQSKPYLEEIAASIEERHCDLTGRHRYLREKITTMERSIPALMAYNMWKSGKTCDDPPFCKIREIMNKLSPDLDPTEKLLRNLKSTVKDLNMETTELHDKIIDADVKLEETDIELESLELANKEMNDQADKIEKEIRCYQCTSLQSINSDDVICLTKIHQLAKDELELKNCIKQLEEKEILYVEQLDRLLASKEFQNISGNNKMLKRIQDLEINERKMYCALQFYKNNIQQLKKELVRKKSEIVQRHLAILRSRLITLIHYLAINVVYQRLKMNVGAIAKENVPMDYLMYRANVELGHYVHWTKDINR